MNDPVKQKCDEYIVHIHNVLSGDYDDPVEAREKLHSLLNDLECLISELTGVDTMDLGTNEYRF